MEEKIIITNILTLVKGLCNTVYHATIESNDINFEDILKSYLKLQKEIYIYMRDNKMYTVELVEKSKLNKLKEEYCF